MLGLRAGPPAHRPQHVPFTPSDERTIAEFLAAVNPEGDHRHGQKLWQALEVNANNKSGP